MSEERKRDSELLGGIVVVAIFAAIVVSSIRSVYHQPFKRVLIEGGEEVFCRRIEGNLKYGIDLKQCSDGYDRYGINKPIKVVRPQ